MSGLLDYITDSNAYIKFLFETAIQHKIIECKENFELAKSYEVPCPPDWGHYDDWRNIEDKFIEERCKSYIRIAHYLSQKDKNNIEFYDLICHALFQIEQDVDLKKTLINEILKYTSNDSLRLKYAEELIKINSHTNMGIYPDTYDLIFGLDKLKDPNGKFFDFDYTNIYIDKIIKEGEGYFWNIKTHIELRFVNENPEYSGYPTREIKLLFEDVSHFSFKHFGNECRSIKVYKNYYSLIFKAFCIDYPFVEIECKNIHVNEVNILQDYVDEDIDDYDDEDMGDVLYYD